MKKYLVFSIVGFLLISGVVLAKSDEAAPFQLLWDAISYLQEQIDNIQLIPGPVGPEGPQGAQGEVGPQGPAGEPSWDEARVQNIEDKVFSADYAFCQECGDEPWNCTRQEAAEQCESLDMHLCSLAELNNYAEIGLSSCCWSWVSDPDSTTFSRIKGTLAYFMGPSTRTGIPSYCGGDPGGLRVTMGSDHLKKYNAHCCK